MKVCLVTVDHGRPNLSQQLFNSTVNQRHNECQIDLFVLENSGRSWADEYEFVAKSDPLRVLARIVHCENRGYIGTASRFLSSIDPEKYEWIIVCNNDLAFDEGFFDHLSKSQTLLQNRLIVCPSVIERSCNANPLSRYKYSPIKVALWDFYYRNPFFAGLYEPLRLRVSRIGRIVRRWFSGSVDRPGEIYLGYGAIYLISPAFIRQVGGLPFKTFLYQEESVICSHARRLRSWPYFFPSLKVFHDAHATLRSLDFKSDYQLRRDAWWATRAYLIDS